MEVCNHEDLMRAIGTLEGTVKTYSEGTNKLLERHQEVLDKQQDEISKLKGRQDSLWGKLSIISVGAGAVFGVVGAFIKEIIIGR
jgi:hypothetical protein